MQMAALLLNAEALQDREECAIESDTGGAALVWPAIKRTRSVHIAFLLSRTVARTLTIELVCF